MPKYPRNKRAKIKNAQNIWRVRMEKLHMAEINSENPFQNIEENEITAEPGEPQLNMTEELNENYNSLELMKQHEDGDATLLPSCGYASSNQLASASLTMGGVGDYLETRSQLTEACSMQEAQTDAIAMRTWTEEETFELVMLYKLYPCLWNRNSHLYRNRRASKDALLSIWSEMGPHKFKSVQDVQVKLCSLRKKYYLFLKKEAKMEMKGTPCPPRLRWMNEFQEIIEAGSAEPVKRIQRTLFSSQKEPDSDNSDEIVIAYSEPTSTSNDITSIYIDTMPGEKNTPYVESHLTSQVTINVDPIPPKRIKREEHDEDDTGSSHHMIRQRKETVNDEFQMFADNIAEQLRKLPLDSALKIQLDIQAMVTKERTKFYRKFMRKEHK